LCVSKKLKLPAEITAVTRKMNLKELYNRDHDLHSILKLIKNRRNGYNETDASNFVNDIYGAYWNSDISLDFMYDILTVYPNINISEIAKNNIRNHYPDEYENILKWNDQFLFNGEHYYDANDMWNAMLYQSRAKKLKKTEREGNVTTK